MTPITEADIRESRVVVLGSINFDHVIYVGDFPLPGETILAEGGAESLGGKGANQAVVSSLLGTTVSFIGQVGADSAGAFVREQFDRRCISQELLLTSEQEPTGSAYITVNSKGENTIAVVSGANASITSNEVTDSLATALNRTAGSSKVALTQGETPAAVIETFAEKCFEHGIRFVLNLAPVVPLAKEVLAQADPLIVNEGEARSLIRRFFNEDIDALDIRLAGEAASMLARISPSVVITLGPAGAVVSDHSTRWHQASPKPQRVIDTTGAGDAFVGAVASVLAAGGELLEAVQYGVASGSLAVASLGTANSYPTLEQLIQQVKTVEEATRL